MKEKRRWHKLDSVGKLYASIRSQRVTTVFRISVTLAQKVAPQTLQKALENMMPRFPYYQVYLKRGLFWYYFEHTKDVPQIEEEKNYPCMDFNVKKKKMFPFRILYFSRKISFECAHSLTDGTGGLTFLISLVAEYLRLQGLLSPQVKAPFILDKEEEPKEEEFEVGFSKYYNPTISRIFGIERAYQLPFKLSENGVYHVYTGVLDAEALYQKAKAQGISVTEFLCGVYLKSLCEFAKQHKKKLRPIVLNVPINLRRIFPSKTMRNFFLSVTPSIDPRIGEYTMAEIWHHVHHYMQFYVNEKHLLKQMSKNMKSEKNLFLRMIPLVIKNVMMPKIYDVWAESKYTSSLSNLGVISLPMALEAQIERFEIISPPSKGNKIKAVALSYKQKTYICFGNLTEETSIEQIFFTNLVKMNLHVKVESNIGG